MTGMFDAARRAAHLDHLRGLITGKRDETAILSFHEVVSAVGHRGERVIGLREVPVSSIVGTVARVGDFDRHFRPLNRCLRDRWERLARIGGDLPPVRLVRLDDMYFVEDGHHRVSVARARGAQTIWAHVRRIGTVACAHNRLTVADLPAKAMERMFLERIPLPEDARLGLHLDDPTQWARLADAAEAWGFRQTIDGKPIADRCLLAETWWREEVVPVVERLRARGIRTSSADIEVYLDGLEACHRARNPAGRRSPRGLALPPVPDPRRCRPWARLL